MTRQEIDCMVLELIGAVDYDIAKSLDPECSEEPEAIPQHMARFRRIVTKYLRRASK